MRKRTPQSAAGEPVSITTADLERYAEGWILDSEIRHTDRTVGNRRLVLGKLLWFLRRKGHAACGRAELLQFIAYLTHGHKEEGGRWGNPRGRRPVRPATVKTYYVYLRTLFVWLVREGVLASCPFDGIDVPVAHPDQIQPFTEEQVRSLVAAAKRSCHPRRDEAVILLLLDTGMRASELCGLRLNDLDMQNKRCTVLGKGRKSRPVYFGRTTARILWNYLREDDRDDHDPVFLSDRGTTSGEALTRSGLLQLVERLGRKAGVKGTRCSPHTFRHTFAVTFLRNGGHVFTLQQLLGHTSLAMTNKYVALAQADVERQHRLYSPVDGIGSKGGGRG